MDINCDMGESFGAYRLGDDAALLAQVTSANIACGYHAGDPLVMRATVRLARAANVAIGAHPGYPDLQGFGRREMSLSSEEVEAMLLYQIGALAGICRAEGAELTHVKPHGALYNQAAVDAKLAAAVARAVRSFSRDLLLVGLAGSCLTAAGEEAGLRAAGEGFPDRVYNPDGTLRSRRLPGALIESAEAAAEHALELAREGVEREGRRVRLRVDTLCVHGDHPQAATEAALIRRRFEAAGVALARLT